MIAGPHRIEPEFVSPPRFAKNGVCAAVRMKLNT
jgi:hypothetical protein